MAGRYRFILQVVVCLPFVLAWVGGLQEPVFAKIMVIVFLLAPFVIRLVYLKMQPDKRFDNFWRRWSSSTESHYSASRPNYTELYGIQSVCLAGHGRDVQVGGWNDNCSITISDEYPNAAGSLATKV